MIAALKALQASIGWGLILNNLRHNKEHFEEVVVDGIDPKTGNDLTVKEGNRYRDKRKYIGDLINTPNTLIAAIENADEGEEVNYDPYHDDATELSKDK